MLFDRVEVPALRDGLRRDAALARRGQAAFQEMIAQIDRVVLGDESGCRFHVGFRELVAVPHQRRQLTDDAIDPLEVSRVAVHQQLVALGSDTDIEE